MVCVFWDRALRGRYTEFQNGRSVYLLNTKTHLRIIVGVTVFPFVWILRIHQREKAGDGGPDRIHSRARHRRDVVMIGEVYHVESVRVT